MADTIESLMLTISADTTQIKRALKSLGTDISKFANDAGKELDNIKPPRTDPLKTVATQFGQSTKSIANDSRNLQFQLNDIATGLASGQSPFMVLSQQSGQLSQILSAQGGGIAQSAKFIGSAFMGMINPINLAIVALGVATYAISAYFTEDEKAAKKAQKALDDEAAKLDAVIQKWGELLPALKLAREAQKQLQEESDIKDVTGKQIAVIFAPTKEVVDELITSIVDLETQLNQFDGGDIIAGKLRTEFDKFVERVNAGTATLEDLNRIKKLVNDSPLESDAAKEFLTTLDKLAPSLAKAAAESKKLVEQQDAALKKSADDAVQAALGVALGVKGIATAFTDVYNMAGKIPGVLDEIGRKAIEAAKVVQTINEQSTGGLTPGIAYLPPLGSNNGQLMLDSQATATRDQIRTDATAAKAYLATIKVGAANIAGLTDDFAIRLATLLMDFPQMGVVSGYRSAELQAQLYANRKPGQMVAPPGRSWHEPGVAADLTYKGVQQVPPFMEALLARAKELGLKSLGAGDEMHFELIDKGALKVAESAKKAATAYDDWKASIEGKTDAQKLETEINADTTTSAYQKIYLIEKEKAVRDGLAAAKAQNLTVDAKITAEINAHADALARAAANEQLATDAAKARTQTLEEQKQAQQQLAQAFDQMASSGFSQFIIDMKNGVSAGEAFRNMLNSIIDQLIRMAVQSAVTSSGLGTFLAGLTGGVPAGGTGIAGALGGIVGSGIASRQRVSPGAWAGAPSYAAGGFVGGGPGATPIIAHKGELIIPVNTLRKAALGAGSRGQEINTTLGDVNIDMSQTGMVTANNEDAKAFGQNVQRLIQLEMVKESRPGGLLRRTSDLR